VVEVLIGQALAQLGTEDIDQPLTYLVGGSGLRLSRFGFGLS
jgi:hypothetical protein